MRFLIYDHRFFRLISLLRIGRYPLIMMELGFITHTVAYFFLLVAFTGCRGSANCHRHSRINRTVLLNSIEVVSS
jgi:hypothetical protein